jgi:hypothetical protein
VPNITTTPDLLYRLWKFHLPFPMTGGFAKLPARQDAGDLWKFANLRLLLLTWMHPGKLLSWAVDSVVV